MESEPEKQHIFNNINTVYFKTQIKLIKIHIFYKGRIPSDAPSAALDLRGIERSTLKMNSGPS
ncbi:MAG TPA: hypothetical protein VL053_17935 [Arachidicoccus sp.]|nr:hypothetical protein [Arachidicoccus sp.]